VPPRYKTPYFSHIMGGYAAGYYAYIWSEVLDANTVQWFRNNGGLTRERRPLPQDPAVAWRQRSRCKLFRELLRLRSRRSSRCWRSVA
jgi:hypothetical protein